MNASKEEIHCRHNATKIAASDNRQIGYVGINELLLKDKNAAWCPQIAILLRTILAM